MKPRVVVHNIYW